MERAGRRKVWTVSEVTAAIGRRFEDIPPVWVEGEIQDLRRRAGQVYFALADGNRLPASINGIVFDRIAPSPADGMRVRVYARPQFWAPRSEVSVRVERIEHVGDGALRAEVDRVRALLEGDGLLDPARKRRPPLLPSAVGLLTSAVGAARDDFLRNAWARFPNARIVTLDVPVQGDLAAGRISRAIPRIAAHPDVEVIVLTRGGGSLEDLMAFNAESVARAIAASPVPVVSAVGHERDVTLSDLAADLRVSTPTAAAAAVVPDEAQLRERLSVARRSLRGTLSRMSTDRRRRVAETDERSRRALRAQAARGSERVLDRRSRLAIAARRVALGGRTRLDGLGERSRRAIEQSAARHGARLSTHGSLLAALGPAATVARGYAIVRDPAGRVLVRTAEVAAGARLEVELMDGRLPVTVRADD